MTIRTPKKPRLTAIILDRVTCSPSIRLAIKTTINGAVKVIDEACTTEIYLTPTTNKNVDVKIKQDIKICTLGKRVVTIFKPYFGTRNIKTKSKCDRNLAQTTCSKE